MVTRIQTSLILGYLIGLIAFVVPILGFVAPKGLAPLVILGGVIGLLIIKIQQRPIKWLNRSVVAILAGLCVWALISTFWSIDGRSASLGAAKLAGNFIAGGLLFTVAQSLDEAENKIALRWFLAGFGFISLVLILEVVLGNPLYIALKGAVIERFINNHGEAFWLNSAAVVLASLVWPLGLAKYKKDGRDYPGRFSKSTALFIFCGISLVLLLTILINFSSGVVALGCGIFGAGVIWLFGRRAAIAASVILVFVGLTLPLAFKYSENPVAQIKSFIPLPSSADHRIKIWEFTADKVDQKRVVGWGLNASKCIPGGKTYLYSDAGKRYGDALPLHPHNAILQVWLELGLPGIILYLGLGVFTIMSIVDRHRSKFESAMMFGQFSTIMIIANLSFGIWQAWWISTIWVSAALMVMVSEKRQTST